MKRVIAALCLGLLFPFTAFAHEGLVVHFKITKVTGDRSSSYANGILMGLDESSTATFHGLYEMHFDAKSLGDGQENIVVTIKDLSGGDPVYVGSAAVILKVGQAQTVALHQLSAATSRYKLIVDTAYGQLPKQ